MNIPAFGGNYCRDVFDKLVNAVNNPYGTKPVLTIVQSDHLVAETYSSGEIKIGSRLVDLCRKFGADSSNAIAHILSHELAHYYQNHAWISNFTSAYASTDWSRHLGENERQLLPIYETQADEIGFFYAFNAGYQSWKVASPLLDSIYLWYELPAELEGYPPLKERKNITETSRKKVETLIPLYRIANYFTLLGKYFPGETQFVYYESAGYCLDHLIHENISTPGVMNNLGVIYLLKAQAYLYTPLQKMLLPVMLDDEPLSLNMDEAAGSRGGFHVASPELSDTAMEWLGKSGDLFSRVIKLDKSYVPAYINMALVHFILREEGGLDDKIKTIHTLINANENYGSVIYQLEAFSYYLSGQSAKMNDFFKKASKYTESPEEILVNKELLNGITSNTREHNLSTKWAVDTLEKIFDKKINEFYKSYRSKQETRIDPYHQKFILWTEQKTGGTMYTFRSLFSQTIYRDMFFFEITDPSYNTTQGAHIGTSANDLQNLYGKPYATHWAGNASYQLYPSQSMMVTIDRKTWQISGIMYYGTKK